MAQLARKELVVHLDRFAGSGPVTVEEIKAIIEEVIPGATLTKKFTIDPTIRKKDNELIKLHIFFSENVDNAVLEQIRQKILVLGGVLEGGVADSFPMQVSECSDTFDMYTPENTDILGSSQNENVTWGLTVDEASAIHVIDPTNPPTFKSTDDLVSGGAFAGRLILPKDCTNSDANISAAGITSPEAKKIKLEACVGLMKDPQTGCAEITLDKVARLSLYGSRFFSSLGTKWGLNGKVVLYSKNPTPGSPEVETVLCEARPGVLYRLYANAEVNGLLFDAFIASEDEVDCGFKHELMQLEGISTEDLQSGALKVKVKNIRSESGAGGGGTDTYATAEGETGFDLGAAGDTGFGTCIKLNSSEVGTSWEDRGKGRIEGGPISEFWNPNLTAWSVEIKFKELEDGYQHSTVPNLACIGHLNDKGYLQLRKHPIGGGAIWFYYKKIDGTKLWGATVVDFSVWNHVLLQWTGTNLEFYVNAVLKQRTAMTEAPLAPLWRDAYIIGDEIRFTYPRPSGYSWRGYLDEFRISNVARFTAANVNDTAPEGLPTAPFDPDPSTLRLLHMNEAFEGAGVLEAAMADSGPLGLPSPDDVDTIVDEISLVSEG